MLVKKRVLMYRVFSWCVKCDLDTVYCVKLAQIKVECYCILLFSVSLMKHRAICMT